MPVGLPVRTPQVVVVGKGTVSVIWKRECPPVGSRSRVRGMGRDEAVPWALHWAREVSASGRPSCRKTAVLYALCLLVHIK